MPGHRIVVIGASAGGVEAMAQLVKRLPGDLDAPICVSMHFPAYSISMLPRILNRADQLEAVHPREKHPLRPGCIYISPPDHHLLVREGFVELSRGPKENGHRPSIDTMFRSAARAYGAAVVGVILTGMLDDGVAGLTVIKSEGGVALVQAPQEAVFKSMPRTAISRVAVDRVLPLDDLADAIVELVADAVAEPPITSHNPENESQIVTQEILAAEAGDRTNAASPLSCPDCGGVLWELSDGNLLRYRCHVGHAYSMDSLLVEQNDAMERALWAAFRAIEEKATIARRMATHARHQNRLRSAEQFSQRAEEADQNARLLRQMIEHQQSLRATGSAENGGVSLNDKAESAL